MNAARNNCMIMWREASVFPALLFVEFLKALS